MILNDVKVEKINTGSEINKKSNSIDSNSCLDVVAVSVSNRWRSTFRNGQHWFVDNKLS